MLGRWAIATLIVVALLALRWLLRRLVEPRLAERGGEAPGICGGGCGHPGEAAGAGRRAGCPAEKALEQRSTRHASG